MAAGSLLNEGRPSVEAFQAIIRSLSRTVVLAAQRQLWLCKRYKTW